MAYKPSNYSSVAPYLIVECAQATIDFLTKVFDAQPLRLIPGDGGKYRHAEVRIDDTVLMLADSLEGWPASPAHVHVYVPDVDNTYRMALEAGAVVLQEPAQRDDPDRRCGFKDAGGTTWWVAQQTGSEAAR